MSKQTKQLILNKNGEKFIFRYQPGNEDQLLDVLVESAKDPRTNFDWFDASVLSFKLTKTLVDKANKLITKNAPKPAGIFG